jgi:hypothetical protein
MTKRSAACGKAQYGLRQSAMRPAAKRSAACGKVQCGLRRNTARCGDRNVRQGGAGCEYGFFENTARRRRVFAVLFPAEFRDMMMPFGMAMRRAGFCVPGMPR